MRHRVSRNLYAYWDGLRGDRPAPERSEIDLLAIRDLLADTFIVEEGPDESYPLRVSGTRVDALWGQERKGTCFSEFWRASDKMLVSTVLVNISEGAAPFVASVSVSASGDARLDLELLLLPLGNFGRGYQRIIGALTPLHSVGWLGQAPTGPLEMNAIRYVDHGAPRPAGLTHKRPKLIVYNGGKA